MLAVIIEYSASRRQCLLLLLIIQLAEVMFAVIIEY